MEGDSASLLSNDDTEYDSEDYEEISQSELLPFSEEELISELSSALTDNISEMTKCKSIIIIKVERNYYAI